MEAGEKGPSTSLRSIRFARRTEKVRLRARTFARLVSATFLTGLGFVGAVREPPAVLARFGKPGFFML